MNLWYRRLRDLLRWPSRPGHSYTGQNLIQSPDFRTVMDHMETRHFPNAGDSRVGILDFYEPATWGHDLRNKAEEIIPLKTPDSFHWTVPLRELMESTSFQKLGFITLYINRTSAIVLSQDQQWTGVQRWAETARVHGDQARQILLLSLPSLNLNWNQSWYSWRIVKV
jgi:hypothetical protein